MGRAPCCDKNNNGLKKGPWTPEEDLKLINYIQTHGPGNWRTLPKNAGLQRCGKSCRLRWTNYLRPDIKRGRFSFEEEETIIQLHSIMGNKWSAIAARLPGRTDNEIKNYWNTHIRKRLLRMGIDPVTHAPRLDLLDMSSILRTLLGNPSSSLMNLQGLLNINTSQALMNPELLKLVATASLLSNIKNNNENNSDLASQNNNILQQIIAGNCQVQNYQVAPKQESTTTQGTNVEGLFSSGKIANLSCSNSPQNSTHFGEIADENLILQQNQQVGLVQSLNRANQDLGYHDSVLSSPKPMNSSSNYVNSSSTEEEWDSYCSELFKFEIPESLDISDFL